MKKESLNGQYPKETRLVAYCRLHRVSLTVRQLKKKHCLEKNCHHISRYNHCWWKEREVLKRKRKVSKIQTDGDNITRTG